MKTIRILLVFSAAAAAGLSQGNGAPRNELAFGLGGIPSVSRGASPGLTLGPGPALQVNYARRIFDADKLALYGEINFVASPLRNVSSSLSFATHDVASLYATPGLRLKILPRARVSPYIAAGGGYSDYEQSTTQLSGSPNPAPRQLSRGVLDFGAGVDARIWPWLALRGEVRDYFSGSPAYNVSTIGGGQNNVVGLGAFVLRWH